MVYITVKTCSSLGQIFRYCRLSFLFEMDVSSCRLSTTPILSHVVRVFCTATIPISCLSYRIDHAREAPVILSKQKRPGFCRSTCFAATFLVGGKAKMDASSFSIEYSQQKTVHINITNHRICTKKSNYSDNTFLLAPFERLRNISFDVVYALETNCNTITVFSVVFTIDAVITVYDDTRDR